MQTKTLILLVLAIPLAATAAVPLLGFLPQGEARPRAAEGSAGELARLERQIATLAARQEELERAQREMALVPAPAQTRGAAVDVEELVQRALDERAPRGTPAPDRGGEAGAEQRSLRAREAFARLARIGDDEEAREGAWREIREEGLLDDVLALFEEHARQHPDDPEAHVALGEACLQKLFESGMGPEAGRWAVRVDQAFARALELDPGHWDARFARAISLSFWPPALGKQGEAIREFERLLVQQRSLAPRPEHAQTWLFLGNLHQQTGQPGKALAVWKEGLALHPGDPDLARQVALAQDP